MNIHVHHVTDAPWNDTRDIPLKKEHWSHFMATTEERAITYFPPNDRKISLSILSGTIDVDDDKILTVFDPHVDIGGKSYNMHAEPSKVNYLAKQAGYDVIHVVTDFGVDDLFLLDPSLFTPETVRRRQPDGEWGDPTRIRPPQAPAQPASKETMLACVAMHNEQAESLIEVMNSVCKSHGLDNLTLGHSFQQLLAGETVEHPSALADMVQAMPVANNVRAELFTTLTGSPLPATAVEPAISDTSPLSPEPAKHEITAAPRSPSR